MTFSIGRGIGRQMTAEELRQKRPLDLQFDNSVLPISLYADGDVLYADITVAGEDGTPTIELRKNQFTVQHDGWDKNSNKNAIEVINSQSRVVFQLIRESRSSVRLKGAFPIRDGVVIADDTHLVVGHAANECNIKPIFKYPAWKYPGRYVEDYEQPKINEHIPPLPPHRARSPHGRSLADWQNVRLVSVLSRYPRQKVMVLASLGEETWSYAEDFRDVFISSKWAVEGPIPAPIDQPAMDLQLSLAYQLFSAKDLPMPCVALRATLDFLKLKSSRKFVFDPDVPIDKIVLWVGAKSPDTANPNLFPPLGLRRR